MFTKRGRRWARTAAAIVAGGALALGVTGPAAADPPATGVATSPEHTSVELVLNGKRMTTSELALTIDGTRVPAFCIDFHTGVALSGTYAEGSWDRSGIAPEKLGKVQWVLTHGYPNADPAALLAAADATVPAGVDAARRDVLLYFGTQTAVWTFSDDVVLGDWVADLRLGQQQYDVVKKVHDYLVAHATGQPEPKADLTIDPASASAPAGGKAGPFTVKGPAGEIALAVRGGSAVDADGRPVTSTTNGGRFWLTRDGAGEVSVTVSAQNSVSYGRVFLFSGERAAQKLILGGSTGETVRDSAVAHFAAAPASPSASPSPTGPAESASPSAPAESASPSTPAGSPAPSTSPASNGGRLPLTGSPIAAAAAVGALLLVAGAVAVLIVRRRKVRFTA